MRVFATSDNTQLIPDPTVVYDGVGTTGTLTFDRRKISMVTRSLRSLSKTAATTAI